MRLLVLSAAILLASTSFTIAQDLPVMDGLQLWLDATDESTVFQSIFLEDPASFDDFAVSWADKSDNGFEVFVPDDAGAPLYVEDGINGLASIRFAGEFADGMVVEDAFELGRPYTTFIVNSYWGETQGRTLQSQDSNWLSGLWGGQVSHFADGWVTEPRLPAVTGVPYLVDSVGTETESFATINGDDWTGNSAPVGIPARLAIAGAGLFPGEVSDADVSEIIVYDRALSGEELTSMRSFLMDKYSIAQLAPPPEPDVLEILGGQISTFSGAADLDFTGDFIYAVDVGGPAEDFFGDPLVIGDAEFLPGTNADELDLNDEGITMTVANEIPTWVADIDYGDSDDDDNLELAMQSIRWNVPPGIDIALDVEAGESYKIQMMFQEQCCDRGFDILVEDDVLVDNVTIQEEQGGIANKDAGVVFTHSLVAGDDELNITLGGSVVGRPDNNPILNLFTLEKIEALPPTEPACDPNSQGDLDGNGKVEFADFLALSNSFGTEVSLHTEGDIDCNGTVEFADFLVLSNNFGNTVGAEASSVPEPTGLSLAMIAGLLGGLVRRRRK